MLSKPLYTIDKSKLANDIPALMKQVLFFEKNEMEPHRRAACEKILDLEKILASVHKQEYEKHIKYARYVLGAFYCELKDPRAKEYLLHASNGTESVLAAQYWLLIFFDSHPLIAEDREQRKEEKRKYEKIAQYYVTNLVKGLQVNAFALEILPDKEKNNLGLYLLSKLPILKKTEVALSYTTAVFNLWQLIGMSSHEASYMIAKLLDKTYMMHVRPLTYFIPFYYFQAYLLGDAPALTPLKNYFANKVVGPYTEIILEKIKKLQINSPFDNACHLNNLTHVIEMAEYFCQQYLPPNHPNFDDGDKLRPALYKMIARSLTNQLQQENNYSDENLQRFINRVNDFIENFPDQSSPECRILREQFNLYQQEMKILPRKPVVDQVLTRDEVEDFCIKGRDLFQENPFKGKDKFYEFLYKLHALSAEQREENALAISYIHHTLGVLHYQSYLVGGFTKDKYLAYSYLNAAANVGLLSARYWLMKGLTTQYLITQDEKTREEIAARIIDQVVYLIRELPLHKLNDGNALQGISYTQQFELYEMLKNSLQFEPKQSSREVINKLRVTGEINAIQLENCLGWLLNSLDLCTVYIPGLECEKAKILEKIEKKQITDVYKRLKVSLHYFSGLLHGEVLGFEGLINLFGTTFENAKRRPSPLDNEIVAKVKELKIIFDNKEMYTRRGMEKTNSLIEKFAALNGQRRNDNVQVILAAFKIIFGLTLVSQPLEKKQRQHKTLPYAKEKLNELLQSKIINDPKIAISVEDLRKRIARTMQEEKKIVQYKEVVGKIKVKPLWIKIIKELEQSSGKAYLTGSFVRDHLRQQKRVKGQSPIIFVPEVEIVTSAPLPSTSPVKIGGFTFFRNPGNHSLYESKIVYITIRFSQHLGIDLLSDANQLFTVNAFYADETGKIIDPTRLALKHLLSGEAYFPEEDGKRLVLHPRFIFDYIALLSRGFKTKYGPEIVSPAVGLLSKLLTAKQFYMELGQLLTQGYGANALSCLVSFGVMAEYLPGISDKQLDVLEETLRQFDKIYAENMAIYREPRISSDQIFAHIVHARIESDREKGMNELSLSDSVEKITTELKFPMMLKKKIVANKLFTGKDASNEPNTSSHHAALFAAPKYDPKTSTSGIKKQGYGI